MGVAFAIEHFLQTYNWDKKTREFKITPVPGQVTVHEFDYKAVNKVIYKNNSVGIHEAFNPPGIFTTLGAQPPL